MENLPKLHNYRKLMSNSEEIPYVWDRPWGCASENFPWHIYLVQDDKAHRMVSYQTKELAVERGNRDIETFRNSDGAYVLVNNWLTDEFVVIR